MRILDGAIGTQLARAGFVLQPPDFSVAANQKAPALVSEIYRSYLDAGAQALTLNSFGLSGGLELDAPDFAQTLALRARQAWTLTEPLAPGPPFWAALSLGVEPSPGARLLAETRALVDAGVSHFRFETLCELDPLIDLQDEFFAAFDAGAVKVVLSLCPAKRPMSELLSSLESSRWLSDPRVAALGINCVNRSDLAQALTELASWLKAHPRTKILDIELRPHLSGLSPQGLWQTHACDPSTLVQSTQSMLSTLPDRLLDRIALGTCCGGGPAHIQALHEAFGTCRSRANPKRPG